jgi:putative isomerase
MSRTIAIFILIISLSLGASPSSTNQDRILIGAYDPSYINGLVWITGKQTFFGIRFLVYRPGAALEETPRRYEFGPNAANSSYASLSWKSQFDDNNAITLRWARISQNTLIGQISVPSAVRVAIEAYRPWSEASSGGSWTNYMAQADRNMIFGEQVQNQPGSAASRRFLLLTDQAPNGGASYEDPESMRKTLVKEGLARQANDQQRAGLFRYATLSFDLNQNKTIGFVAQIGADFEEMARAAQKVRQKPIVEQLNLAEKNYNLSRAASAGALGETFEIISRAINWNRFYSPDKQLDYISMHRLPSWTEVRNEVNDSQDISLSWNSFISAMMAAMADSGNPGGTIRLLFESQTADGRLPLRRHLGKSPRGEPATLVGRSMPPLGALTVWKIYLLTNDLDLLAWAYPRLLQWNDWWLANRGDGQAWRDGNGDGLLEYGYDAEIEQGALGARTLSNDERFRLAITESGIEIPSIDKSSAQANSPGSSGEQNQEAKFNDRTHTIELSPVALNSLYALDTEMLFMIASELGLKPDMERLKLRHERLKDLINYKLWSEKDGLYLNRAWNGRFSPRITPENFYPLLAGIPDEERAKRMLITLRDAKKFWKEFPYASLARDDPEYSPTGIGMGAIWSVNNYLVYLGLRRYGFHDEAAELARRSNIIGRSGSVKRGLDDHYSSQDGRAVTPGLETDLSSFAGLMLFSGIEEMICADPWSGMAIGSAAATEESRIERVKIFGGEFTVIAGPKSTILERGGNTELECDGPVRIRAYRSAERGLGFTIETKERVRIQVPAVDGRKLTVSVNDRILGSTSVGAAANFKVEPGRHSVVVVK